jgi:hypothetical protein
MAPRVGDQQHFTRKHEETINGVTRVRKKNSTQEALRAQKGASIRLAILAGLEEIPSRPAMDRNQAHPNVCASSDRVV